MAEVMPKGVNWIKGAAEEFGPANNIVKTRGGLDIGYNYLMVAPMPLN